MDATSVQEQRAMQVVSGAEHGGKYIRKVNANSDCNSDLSLRLSPDETTIYLIDNDNSEEMEESSDEDNDEQKIDVRENHGTRDHHAVNSLHLDIEKLARPYCRLDNFERRGSLEKHMKRAHSVKSADISTCRYCNIRHQNLNSLYNHMRTVHSTQVSSKIQYRCKICGFQFTTLDALRLHAEQHHSKDALPSLVSEHADVDKHQVQLFQCYRCQNSYSDKNDYRKHFSSVHYDYCSVYNIEPLRKKCKYYVDANKVTKTVPATSAVLSPALTHTYTNQDLKSQANTLKSPLSTRILPEMTENKNTGLLTCEECSLTFSNQNLYEAHLTIHGQLNLDHSPRALSVRKQADCDPSPAQLSTLPTCTYCGAYLSSRDALEMHTFSHFLTQIVDYDCIPCMKSFNSPDQLRKHLIDIHAQHLFKCSLCKEIFDSKVNIQEHLALTHSAESTKYQCTECRTVFLTATEWQMHVKLTHLHIAQLHCLLCTESFEAELECHMSIHGKIFNCESCDKTFRTQSFLDKHIQDVHNPDELTGFNTDALKHDTIVRIANGPMGSGRYPLEINNLSDADVTMPSPLQQNTSWHPTVPIEEHVCGICNMGFAEQASLQMHMIQCGNNVSGPDGLEFHEISHGLNRTYQSALSPTSTSASLYSLSASSTAIRAETTTLSLPSPSNLQTFSMLPTEPISHVSKQTHGQRIFKEFNLCSRWLKGKLHPCEIPQRGSCVTRQKELTNEEAVYRHAQTHGELGILDGCAVCGHISGSIEEPHIHGERNSQMKAFMCSVCLKEFSLEENLMSKVNQKNGQTYLVCKMCYHTELPVSCPMCNTCFGCDEQQHVHISSEHSEKTFQCVKCHKSFGTEFDIQVHVAKHVLSEGINIHDCKICLKNFDSPLNLQCHLIGHTFEGADITCYVCNQVFQTIPEIQNHILEHGPSLWRYSCDQCWQRFFFSSELENHLHSHSLLQMLWTTHIHSASTVSQPTDANLVYNPTMSAPTSNCHGERISPVPTLSTNTDEETRLSLLASANTSHICSLCDQTFGTVEFLNQHIMMSHNVCGSESKTSIYSCSECHVICPDLSKYQAHLKTHKSALSTKCRICSALFSSQKTRNRHMVICHDIKPYECGICKERFTRPS